MNRRLFVRHVAAGLTLPLLPSVSSIAIGGSVRDQALRNASTLFSGDRLGTLRHITIAHVYSPERTSQTALKALAAAELTAVNTLLGTNFSLTAQTWAQLSAAPHGSHGTRLERDGVTLNWQALARIGGETASPSTRLIVSGSKGALQASPAGNGYQLIDRQGEAVVLGSQLSQAVDQLPQRRSSQA